MDMKEIGAMCKSHTPTKQELQEIFGEDRYGYEEYLTKHPVKDEFAALKELHAMESGLNSIDASFGRMTISDGPVPDIAEEELDYIGFPVNKNEFMKNDAGKNMVSLVDPAFILLLGEILTFGAKKYAPNNWQLCEDTSRYKDALLRHIYAYLAGEKVDPESGLSHLGHAAFGLMCLNYFDQKEQN